MKLLLQLTPYEVLSIQTAAEIIPKNIMSIKAPELWKQGYKGQGITIAVIDSGCQLDHPDLKDRIIGGRNFTREDRGNPEKYSDYNGHGTHVAGIIAASGNSTGVIGVAPEASLLILKIMNKKGQGSYDALIAAIEYAISQKVSIISMSLGGHSDSTKLHNVIKKAVHQGIALVCAAANNGDGNPLTEEYAYPAYYSDVISVGAEADNRVAHFSNTNNQIDLIAPGVGILSTYINSKYASLSGTSMAAPHVSGALALLMNWGEKNFGRALTEGEVYAQLIRRAVSLGHSKMEEGNGILILNLPEVLEEMLKQNRLN